MYKILGADQKQYGPVTAEQVREWITQGRANAQTKAQPEGATDWIPLAQLPEFADVLQQAAQPRTPGALPGFPALPVTPNAPVKTSGLAIASLVLGVLGVVSCGVTALVGLILGIIAMVKIERSNGQLAGRGIALAGLIVSGLFLLLIPFMAAITIPAFTKARQKAYMVQCLSNMRQLDLAMVMYADANSGKFPASAKWCEALTTYVGSSSNVFICKAAKSGQRSDYAFNSHLAGVDLKTVSSPGTTVLVFEATGGWNASGGKELLPMPPRHEGTYIIGFVDGHCEAVRSNRLSQLRWNP